MLPTYRRSGFAPTSYIFRIPGAHADLRDGKIGEIGNDVKLGLRKNKIKKKKGAHQEEY
jgi:hypothetical protein